MGIGTKKTYTSADLARSLYLGAECRPGIIVAAISCMLEARVITWLESLLVLRVVEDMRAHGEADEGILPRIKLDMPRHR